MLLLPPLLICIFTTAKSRRFIYERKAVGVFIFIIGYLKEAMTWIESVLIGSINRANKAAVKQFLGQNALFMNEYFQTKITFSDYLGKFFNVIFSNFGSQSALFYEFHAHSTKVWCIKQKGNTTEVIQLRTLTRLNNTFGFVKQTFKSKNILNVTFDQDDERITNEYLRLLRTRINEIMCAPVLVNNSVWAVMQIINNKIFGENVDNAIKEANKYCAVTLQFKRLRDTFRVKQAENEALASRIEYFVRLPHIGYPELIDFSLGGEEIGEFTFYPTKLESVIPIVFNIIKQACPTLIQEETLKKFVLATFRSHRIDLPFHNAFQSCDSANTMYSILNRNLEFFNEYEILVLLLASFLYCVDHRGCSDLSMEVTRHAFTKLYKGDYKANNRYHLGKFLIDKTGLIAHLPVEQQENIMRLLQDAIFKEKKYNQSIHRNNFLKFVCEKDINNMTLAHRTRVIEFLLWCSYHCRHINTYKNSKKLTAAIYEEYFLDGEILMKNGIQPDPHQRPENKENILELEVDFLSSTLLPGYSVLMKLFPSTSLLYDIAKFLMENYRDAMEMDKRRIWNPSISQGLSPFC